MMTVLYNALNSVVALPTEGVDRNIQRGDPPGNILQSPSPRRAWIEMPMFWNAPIKSRRPPHGGRG